METVRFQIFMFSITLYGGLLIGLSYDIYRAIKGVKRKKGFITSFWDLLFLLVSFTIIIYILFSSNFGDMRAYVFIGFVVGFFIYIKIIGRIIEITLIKLFRTVSLLFMKCKNYLLKPIKIIFNLIVKPIIIIIGYFNTMIGRFKKITLIPKKALKECKKYYKLVVKRDKH